MTQSTQTTIPNSVLGSFILAKFVQDTALRAPIPFLGVITAAYGQDLSTIGWLATALSLASLAAPFTSLLIARFGQRNVLFYPLGLFVISCSLLPFAPNFAVVLVLFILLGVAKAMFSPQVHTFIAERVPLERRGTVVGILELSWALSFMIGAPVFGVLVEQVSWSAPFVLLALLGFCGFVAAWVFVRPQLIETSTRAEFSFAPWRLVWQQSKAILFLLFSAGITFAAQIPWLIYPQWMKSQFGLDNLQIGLISTAIGIADIVAEALIIVYLDRVNKGLAIIGAGVLYGLSFVGFGVFSHSLVGMVLALFLLYLAFEITIVASIAVGAEVVPESRVAMMGFTTTANATGRIIGSLVAVGLFAGNRFWLVTLVACLVIGSSLLCFYLATSKLEPTTSKL